MDHLSQWTVPPMEMPKHIFEPALYLPYQLDRQDLAKSVDRDQMALKELFDLSAS